MTHPPPLRPNVGSWAIIDAQTGDDWLVYLI